MALLAWNTAVKMFRNIALHFPTISYGRKRLYSIKTTTYIFFSSISSDWPSSHSFQCTSWLELGSQVGSTTDHYHCCLSNTAKVKPWWNYHLKSNGEPSFARWQYWSRTKDVSFCFEKKLCVKNQNKQLFVPNQCCHLVVNMLPIGKKIISRRIGTANLGNRSLAVNQTSQNLLTFFDKLIKVRDC